MKLKDVSGCYDVPYRPIMEAPLVVKVWHTITYPSSKPVRDGLSKLCMAECNLEATARSRSDPAETTAKKCRQPKQQGQSPKPRQQLPKSKGLLQFIPQLKPKPQKAKRHVFDEVVGGLRLAHPPPISTLAWGAR